VCEADDLMLRPLLEQHDNGFVEVVPSEGFA